MPVRAEHLVGRRAEIGVLAEALAGIGPRTPAVVAVTGEPGIGKTALFTELAARAGRSGHLVLTGSATELERDLPFSVFVDALDRHVEERAPELTARLADSTRAELAGLLPALSDSTVHSGMPLQHERYRAHRAVRELLELLATPPGLLLVLDDLHWADPGSVELLSALLRRPPAAPLLMALGLRPHQAPDRLSAALERAHRVGTLVRVEPAALGPEEARQLLRATVTPNAAAELHRRSGGNPFYLQQLARSPGAAGARPAGPALRDAGVPRAVAAALAEELAALGPTARRLAEGAAVVGDPFDAELAAAAAGLDPAAAPTALDELLRRDLLRSTDLPRSFRFRHPLVRTAAYEGIPAGWRLGAHERAAAALGRLGAAPVARAAHLEQSARHGDRVAAGVLREAGAAAAHRAPGSAARWFAAALRLLPPSGPTAERIELLGARAAALAATGELAGSRAALLEGLALSPDSTGTTVRLTAACAAVEHLLGQPDAAHRHLLDALGAVSDPASPEAVALEIELAVDGFQRLDWATMRERASRAATAAATLGDLPLQAAATAALALADVFAGAVPAAQEHRAEAAFLVDRMPDDALARRLDAAVHLAGAEHYLDRLDDSIRHARRAMAVGSVTGQGRLFPLAVAYLGTSLARRGRLAESAQVLDAAVEAARLSDNLQALVSALSNRSATALAAADLDEASAAAQEATESARGLGGGPVAAYAAIVLAEGLLLAGDAERAVAVLTDAAGGPDLPRTPLVVRAPRLELLTRGHLALGRMQAARSAAERARECAAAVGLPLAAAAADRAGAAVLLTAGEPAAAARLAAHSAAAADDAGAVVESGLSRTVAGRALAAAGERDQAAAELTLAVAAFTRCGALRYRDEAERQLRRLGVRISRRTDRGLTDGFRLGALTEREMQVARLVVARRTNAEIAADLFLSTKTVETHLRNIFHKLDLTSRVQLAHAVERADRDGA
jgi:DNA-binding CsgD family transcriptional regulator